MKHYQIANTDLSVSRIAYGSMGLGKNWDQTPLSDDLKNKANDLVKAAYEHGVNHIDLADIYAWGKSDAAVGYALEQDPGLREKLVLQAKAGIIIGANPDFGQPSRYDYSYEHLTEGVAGTLERLGTDYVDILAFHRPDPLVDLDEVARAAEYLSKQGMVRYFGVSNHSPLQIELLKKALGVPLVVNQLELSLPHHHLISRGILVNQTAATFVNAEETLEYCRLNDITIQAWSPVAGGKLFKTGADTPENVKATQKLLTELAEEKETTQEAIALGWLLRHPAGIQPIVGTTNLERLADSVKADEVELSRKEWYRLLEAARGTKVP